MFVRRLLECTEFIAGDSTALREILQPHRETLSLRYSLAQATVRPGEVSRPHRLKTSSEVYYILRGEGTMYIEGESAPVRGGDTIYIPPSAAQHIENTG